MNLNGREGSIEGSIRETCRMEVDAEAELLSGGMYVPSDRKDLMFDIRSVDEAEGDRSMIGSGLLPGLLCFALGIEPKGADVGAAASLEPPDLLPCLPTRMKYSADLRTCEKSYIDGQGQMRRAKISPKKLVIAYRRLDAAKDSISVSHSPFIVINSL